jgi:hypothetical protein
VACIREGRRLRSHSCRIARKDGRYRSEEGAARRTGTPESRAARRAWRGRRPQVQAAKIAEPLLSVLRRDVPGCKLILTATDCDVVGRSLERGEIDLAVGAFPEVVSATHHCVLYRARYECVYDAEACEAHGAISRAEWLELTADRAEVFRHLNEELRESWKLFSANVIREAATGDPIRIVFVLEAADLGAAETALQQLPLVKDGQFTIQFIELRPFSNWARLFAETREV